MQYVWVTCIVYSPNDWFTFVTPASRSPRASLLYSYWPWQRWPSQSKRLCNCGWVKPNHHFFFLPILHGSHDHSCLPINFWLIFHIIAGDIEILMPFRNSQYVVNQILFIMYKMVFNIAIVRWGSWWGTPRKISSSDDFTRTKKSNELNKKNTTQQHNFHVFDHICNTGIHPVQNWNSLIPYCCTGYI